MASTSTARLAELESKLAVFTPKAALRKLECLEQLEEAKLSSARQVERLHEVLCFLRAYPDDEPVLVQVERMLASFRERSDLRRFRSGLDDTGIAGTDIHYSFFAPMARWLATRYGDSLEVDWQGYKEPSLKAWIESFVLPAEIPGFYDAKLGARQWVDLLRRPDETDAAFLIRSFDALPADASVSQRAFENSNLYFRINGSAGGPSRTVARYARAEVHYQKTPLRRNRPVLARAVETPPRSIRFVSPREGRKLIDLAREAMVTRSRDLDSFACGNPNDVRIIDCGDGLQFACIGLVPDQRLVLEAVYAFLSLKNGVPIGYVLVSALFESSEIAYNVFDTYRGGEAGYVYGRVLGTVRALFGTDSFTIYPYQLGHKNAEGIKSGAWWFYQKLGFRARDKGVLKLMRSELASMRRNPKHRSDRTALKRLAAQNVYWTIGPRRDDVIGVFPAVELSLAITRYVAERFGSDRRRGVRVMAEEAASRLGVRRWRDWPRSERTAFERWSPLILLLPGVDRWTRSSVRALIRVVRAKGGVRESEYVKLFDGHARLRASLLQLARSGENESNT